MPDLGSPVGFDLATVLTGSGLTLLLSAAIAAYGNRLSFDPAELYALSGAGLIVAGVGFGALLVATGRR
ncbi:hypothetical protein [Haloarcula salina]|uniref:Uncharacterized protein n=1 Tax=Haloarcula salina TaxID=1429914 RepID=A0AA41G319_9EURY|nr:hypothetical protein [Haloarcula salina]MBV0902611.1 hypothetical protein [Haloarcula salina]